MAGTCSQTLFNNQDKHCPVKGLCSAVVYWCLKMTRKILQLLVSLAKSCFLLLSFFRNFLPSIYCFLVRKVKEINKSNGNHKVLIRSSLKELCLSWKMNKRRKGEEEEEGEETADEKKKVSSEKTKNISKKTHYTNWN